MWDPRKLAPWKYCSQEPSTPPTPDPKYMSGQKQMEKPTPPVPPTRSSNPRVEKLLNAKFKYDCEQYFKDLALYEETRGLVEDTSNTTPLTPDESFVRPLMEEERTRNKIWNEAIEKAAEISWTHFMDACKKQGVSPASKDDFLAACSIRTLKK